MFGSNICKAIVRGSRPVIAFASEPEALDQRLPPNMSQASGSSNPEAAPAILPESNLLCIQCHEPTTVDASQQVFRDRKTGVGSRRCNGCNTANAKIGRIPNPAIRAEYWKMDYKSRVPLVCNHRKWSSHNVSQTASHLYIGGWGAELNREIVSCRACARGVYV